jgi:hypothetical protein
MKSRIQLAHKLIAHGESAAKIGSAAEAKAFLDKGNELLRNHEPMTRQDLRNIDTMRLIDEAQERWLQWIAR